MTWEPGRPVRLETARYRLRSLGPEDATERYLGWLRDPEVMRYANARFEPHTLDGLRAFIRSHDDRRAFLLGVFDAAGDRHVGNYRAECHPHHRHAHLGVLIGDRAHWGRGAVAETRAAVLDFLFGPAGMWKVCGACYAANAAAVFNYRLQGFEVEGILRSHVACGEGRGDVIQFAMFGDRWRTRRREGKP